MTEYIRVQREGKVILKEEEDPKLEAEPIIPKEVLDAIAVLRKYTSGPETLEKLNAKRETMDAQLTEAKKKVVELDEAIDAIDDEIRQIEKSANKMDDLEEYVKGFA